jgi:hypothetical protein
MKAIIYKRIEIDKFMNRFMKLLQIRYYSWKIKEENDENMKRSLLSISLLRPIVVAFAEFTFGCVPLAIAAFTAAAAAAAAIAADELALAAFCCC